MSDLPKYSYTTDDHRAESSPLISAESRAENGWSKPTTQAQAVQVGSTSNAQRQNVLYVFEPTYPVAGQREQVIGVLGRSRDECVSIAQRAFPVLQSYPDERIVFDACIAPAYESLAGHGVNATSARAQPVAGNPYNGTLPNYPPGNAWSRIMDDAWDQFAASPPARLRVRVEDSAGDIALRRRRERRMIFKAVGIPLIVIFFMMAALFTLVAAPEDGE